MADFFKKGNRFAGNKIQDLISGSSRALRHIKPDELPTEEDKKTAHEVIAALKQFQEKVPYKFLHDYSIYDREIGRPRMSDQEKYDKVVKPFTDMANAYLDLVT